MTTLGFLGLVVFLGCWAVLALGVLARRRCRTVGAKQQTVCFFHPFADGLGGGERVLWRTIAALHRNYRNSVRIVVCTGPASDGSRDFSRIIRRASDRFGLNLGGAQIEPCWLRTRKLAEPSTYPVLTLLLQTLGAAVPALEGFWQARPSVVIDTTGHIAAVATGKLLFGCRTASYVHYPTISTDMLESVRTGRLGVHNREPEKQSATARRAKILYYRAFAAFYGTLGRCNDITIVNSSWTRAHIAALWGGSPRVVFPPCPVKALSHLPLRRRGLRIISIGQFRPEKDHSLQLQSFAKFLSSYEHEADAAHLVLIGGARNSEDERLVADLQSEAVALGVGDRVTFLVNVPYHELETELRRASVALHTMWNEHFGIGVVECMAAGAITIAHKSGGPASDIVTPNRNGFLAETATEYAARIARVAVMSADERRMMQERARASSLRFDDAVFDGEIVKALRAAVQ